MYKPSKGTGNISANFGMFGAMKVFCVWLLEGLTRCSSGKNVSNLEREDFCYYESNSISYRLCGFRRSCIGAVTSGTGWLDRADEWFWLRERFSQCHLADRSFWVSVEFDDV